MNHTTPADLPAINPSKTDPPATPNLLPLATTVLLALASPFAGMVFLGLSLGKRTAIATWTLAIGALSIAQYSALRANGPGGSALIAHKDFVLAQVTTLYLACALASAALLSRPYTLPSAPTPRQRIVRWGFAIALLASAQYGPLAFHAKISRDSARVYAAQEALQAQAAEIDKRPPSDETTTWKRAALLAFDHTAGLPPAGYLSSNAKFDLHQAAVTACRQDSMLNATACTTAQALEGADPLTDSGRWAALLQTLNPVPLLTGE